MTADEPNRCTATTGKGHRCKLPAGDEGLCHVHRGANVGRPAKLDDLTEARIIRAIEAGATYKLAAKAGGITYETLRTWRNEHDCFDAKCESAEWRAANLWLDAIDAAADKGDWRAAAWRLERRYPSEYGKRRGDGGDETTDTASGPVVYIPDKNRTVDDLPLDEQKRLLRERLDALDELDDLPHPDDLKGLAEFRDD